MVQSLEVKGWLMDEASTWVGKKFTSMMRIADTTGRNETFKGTTASTSQGSRCPSAWLWWFPEDLSDSLTPFCMELRLRNFLGAYVMIYMFIMFFWDIRLLSLLVKDRHFVKHCIWHNWCRNGGIYCDNIYQRSKLGADSYTGLFQMARTSTLSQTIIALLHDKFPKGDSMKQFQVWSRWLKAHF